MNRNKFKNSINSINNSTTGNIGIIFIIFFSIFNIVRCSDDVERKNEIEKLKEQVELKKKYDNYTSEQVFFLTSKIGVIKVKFEGSNLVKNYDKYCSLIHDFISNWKSNYIDDLVFPPKFSMESENYQSEVDFVLSCEKNAKNLKNTNF